MLGKSSLELHVTYYKMFRGETKGGKSRDLGDLGCFVCVYLLGIHFQPRYLFDLGHEALAASSLSSCQIQHDLFSSNRNQPKVDGTDMISSSKRSKQER